MFIEDLEQAKNWLICIGYYRLSGYWYPFRDRSNAITVHGSKIQVVLDSLRVGTTLGHAYELYVFDKRLRMLFMDAIEQIEIAIRVDIAFIMGRIEPWAHRNPNNFNRHFRSVDPDDSAVRHTKWLKYLDSLTSRSQEEFAKHFNKTYKDAPPIWIAIELWDFGILSKLVSGMQEKDLQQLADKYKMPRRNMLSSWVNSLNYVRNICAHHGRLWNKAMVVQPAPSRGNDIPLFEHWARNDNAKKRLYAVASVIQFLLRVIGPKSTWNKRLTDCMAGFPSGPVVDIQSGGFPPNWMEEELWRLD